jgi:hypothetical protein
MLHDGEHCSVEKLFAQFVGGRAILLSKVSVVKLNLVSKRTITRLCVIFRIAPLNRRRFAILAGSMIHLNLIAARQLRNYKAASIKVNVSHRKP